MLLLFQSTGAVPGWVGPTIAVSTVVIAIAFVAIGIAAFLAARQLSQASRSVASTVERLETEANPAIRAVAELAQDGRELSADVRREAKALLKTSKRLRKKVRRGADQVEERIEDLDALYETVYEEVEDTALGLAASLRTAKRARGLLSPLSRLWRGRRR